MKTKKWANNDNQDSTKKNMENKNIIFINLNHNKGQF